VVDHEGAQDRTAARAAPLYLDFNTGREPRTVRHNMTVAIRIVHSDTLSSTARWFPFRRGEKSFALQDDAASNVVCNNNGKCGWPWFEGMGFM
jgi:hypothetical protein